MDYTRTALDAEEKSAISCSSNARVANNLLSIAGSDDVATPFTKDIFPALIVFPQS